MIAKIIILVLAFITVCLFIISLIFMYFGIVELFKKTDKDDVDKIVFIETKETEEKNYDYEFRESHKQCS